MLIGFIGDVHGNWADLHKAIDQLAIAGAERIVQVGDFGFWPGIIDSLKTEVPVYWIDGNHEHFPYLYDIVNNNRLVPQEILENVFYIPRGTVLNWGNIVFGFIGGGFSIDHKLRREGTDLFSAYERPKHSEVKPVIAHNAEFIVSHDAPSEAVHYMPRGLLKNSIEDRESRYVMQTVLEHGKAKNWVHGHYHMRYSAPLATCRMIGLACAPDAVLFDTKQQQFIY